MKLKMHSFTDRTDNFLVTAPNYKILQQSTLPAFLRFVEGFGHYKDSKSEFIMHNGGTCFLRTETDPDSIVGIPNVRHIWGDEAGKYRLYFWENMQARANAKGATIDLTTSPYSRNWVFKELIDPSLKGRRKDVELVQAASWENPYHTFHDPEKRALARSTMDPRRFDMIFGGEWGQIAGLVFDCFDEDKHMVEPFQLPPGTVYVGGVDWGFTEPFVVVIRAITPDGRQYQISEFYKTGMTPHRCFDVLEEKAKTFGVKRYWCGHEQPGMIEELNQRLGRANLKCSAQAADFDVTRGNGQHYQLIASGKYKIFKNSSPHTLDEYSTYHYPDPKDLKPDQDSKELKPVGQYDHAMSANRFISIHEFRSELKHTPKLPGGDGLTQNEDISKRLERLKRRPRSDSYERWGESGGEGS